MDTENNNNGANIMDAIFYLITFRYVWTAPELAGPSYNPPKAGTVVWTTLTAATLGDARAMAADIMAGEHDDCCGFVTTIQIDRKGPAVRNRVAMAKRDRVVSCSCGDHLVHDRAGEWKTDSDRAFSTDICAELGANNR